MLEGLASTIRPAIDQYLHDYRQARRVSDLRRAAMTDPLTGLGNRRALETSIPVGDYALISLDLDHFKEVNDSFGHSVRRHRPVARGRRPHCIRPWRGHRLPHGWRGVPHRAAGRRRRARDPRVRARATRREGPRSHGAGPRRSLTISLGVAAVTSGDVADFNAALNDADAALYESKHAGRDRVTVAPADRVGLGRQAPTRRVVCRSLLVRPPTGRLAQGLARFLDTEEVTGSIPVSPTITWQPVSSAGSHRQNGCPAGSSKTRTSVLRLMVREPGAEGHGALDLRVEPVHLDVEVRHHALLARCVLARHGRHVVGVALEGQPAPPCGDRSFTQPSSSCSTSQPRSAR